MIGSDTHIVFGAPSKSRGLIDFAQSWYIVWSYDTRSTTNIRGQGVKGQGHSVTNVGKIR